MQGVNHSLSENDVNALAERIKSGIANHGVYVIDEIELELICNLYQPQSDDEKRLHIDNFAVAFGFHAYVSSSLKLAIFRKLN